MWPFKKNKYKKLKREEVVNAIIELDNRQTLLEEEIKNKALEEKDLFNKGKQEKNRQLRLLYAKKIDALKKDQQSLLERSLYLLYNVQLLKKLKDALEDKEFISATSDVSLQELLKDQKNLAKFLNGALQTKVKSEEIMTEADDIFNQVKDSYNPDERIYGINSNDDQLLSMFEESEDLPNNEDKQEEVEENVNI